MLKYEQRRHYPLILTKQIVKLEQEDQSHIYQNNGYDFMQRLIISTPQDQKGSRFSNLDHLTH